MVKDTFTLVLFSYLVFPMLRLLLFWVWVLPFWAAAQTYSWASYPTKCTGVGVYTQANMTVDVTGSGWTNTGPQAAVSACAATSGNRYFSPKYVTSPNASAPDWQMSGLGLGVNWSNTSTSVTVNITFGTAVCGPVSFSIYDINAGTWGGFNPVWRDKVTITGTNSGGTTIYPTSIASCSNNTVGGANSNVISAGLQGCTNASQLITFSSASVKTITIVYSSMGIDATYGTDPDPEYIIISDISTGTCPLPMRTENLRLDCDAQHPQLSWHCAEASSLRFEVLRSADGRVFESLARMEGKNNQNMYAWSDPFPAAHPALYKLRETDIDGNVYETDAVLSSSSCRPAFSFRVVPNPVVSGDASLHYEAASETEVSGFIMGCRGERLREFTFPVHESLSGDVPLDLEGLPQGVYFVGIIVEGEMRVEKVELH